MSMSIGGNSNQEDKYRVLPFKHCVMNKWIHLIIWKMQIANLVEFDTDIGETQLP